MRRTILRTVAAAIMGCCAATAYAADELAVYVFKDGNAAEGLQIELDGGAKKTVGQEGSAYFDLKAGPHIIGVYDKDKLVYTLKFDSAIGMYADATVSLAFGTDPRGSVQTYFRTESPGERAGAPTGTLLGTITNRETGDPVMDARIFVEGTNFETKTDPFGNYRFIIPRGIYELSIEAAGYGTQVIDDIRVVANVERGASFGLAKRRTGVDASTLDIQAPSIEEVFVIAKFKPTALGEDERYSQGVVDTLGIGELQRFGGSDISQSVIRIPSVTIKDNRFVFIRGLGGRYVTTTLNRALLPSTDPEKRTVPLDLFPTNFVQQLDVKKSFVASMPGESTGGNLVINTRTFPAESEGRLSIQIGGVTGLTGDSVYSDPIRGDYDYLGYDVDRDDGSLFQAISDALDNINDPVAERELNAIGANLLAEDFDPTTTTASPNLILGGSYGNVYDFGDGAEFGFFLAGNYRYEWSKREDGISRTYGGDVNQGTQEILNDFVFNEYTNNIETSGLLNLGISSGNHSYGSNSIISRVTQSRARKEQGVDGDALLESYRTTIDWVERQFLSQQFTGDHVFGMREQWIVNWQLTGSQARRDGPGRRDARFDLAGGDGIYNLEVPVVARRYDELTDVNWDFSSDVDYLFDTAPEDEIKLSFGVQLITRSRDSDSNTYGFGGIGDDNAPNRLVSDVLNEGSITGDPNTGYSFLDKTNSNDSYEADLDLYAGYVSLDTLLDGTHQYIAGVRVEDYEQTTDTFTTTIPPAPLNTSISSTDVLPTFIYNWFFTERQTLRFGAAKTVSRPDFKETSNALFFDPDFNITVRGNPNLETSDALNLDARYQFYWNDLDNISVGLFYKDIDNPIERITNVASGTVGNSRTFENADSADVYGIEFEGRKEWAFGQSLTKSFFISGNLSIIESEVDLQSGGTRALQGQPDYVGNLIFGLDDIENGHELTLLFNQNGDTIVDVGVDGQADIVLEPRLDVTLNYRWYFTDDWQFVFKVDNLLDEDFETTQGGNVFQSYTSGTEFTVGLNWNF